MLAPLWDLSLGVQSCGICGICVRLWSEAAVGRLWDLALGVQTCEICGICVRLCELCFLIKSVDFLCVFNENCYLCKNSLTS